MNLTGKMKFGYLNFSRNSLSRFSNFQSHLKQFGTFNNLSFKYFKPLFLQFSQIQLKHSPFILKKQFSTNQLENQLETENSKTQQLEIFQRGINLTIKEKNPHSAFEWIKTMKKNGIKVDLEYYHLLIHLSGELKQRILLEQIYAEIPSELINSTTQHLVATAYAHMGDIQKLKECETRFNFSKLVQSVFLLEAYATRRNFHECEKLLKSFPISPPEATFTYLLENFEKVQTHFEYFWNEMINTFKLKLEMEETYTLGVKVFSRFGKLTVASQILEQMYDLRIPPTSTTWYYFLEAMNKQEVAVDGLDKWLAIIKAKFERKSKLTTWEVNKLRKFLDHAVISFARIKDGIALLKEIQNSHIRLKPKPDPVPIELIPEPGQIQKVNFPIKPETKPLSLAPAPKKKDMNLLLNRGPDIYLKNLSKEDKQVQKEMESYYEKLLDEDEEIKLPSKSKRKTKSQKK